MRIEIDGKPIDSVRMSVELADGSGSEAILGGEEIARAISDYVQLFDRLMKAYLAGKYTPPEIEALYCAQQQRAAILI